MENTFLVNVMTFPKSRHSLDLCITAASPFMKTRLHFCEWLSSFIWLDTAGKWHNEKGKSKSFFPLLENQEMNKSYQNEAPVACISIQLHIFIQIVFSTVLWITDSTVHLNPESLSITCGFPEHYLDNFKFCIFN